MNETVRVRRVGERREWERKPAVSPLPVSCRAESDARAPERARPCPICHERPRTAPTAAELPMYHHITLRFFIERHVEKMENLMSHVTEIDLLNHTLAIYVILLV